MKTIIVLIAGMASLCISCVADEEQPVVMLAGSWWLEGNILHLKITNTDKATILLEDASHAIPREELKTEWGVLPSLIELGDEEEKRLFGNAFKNNAYWLTPDWVNMRNAHFEWQIHLTEKIAAYLKKKPEAILKCSGIEGSLTRREDMVEDAKTMLLIRFKTDVIFHYLSAEQAGAGQPATRSESKSEGKDKTQPEAEGRSR